MSYTCSLLWKVMLLKTLYLILLLNERILSAASLQYALWQRQNIQMHITCELDLMESKIMVVKEVDGTTFGGCEAVGW